MRSHLTAALLLLSTATQARAQQSPWQGEWGPPDNADSRLTLSGCSPTSCTFILQHKAPNGQRCSTSEPQTLTLSSPASATATMPAQDATHTCALHLQRDASTAHATIAVTQAGTGCNYYCTGTATFDTTLTQRSTTLYTGIHSSECLHQPGPARMATCTDPALSTLEQKWEALYEQFPLIPATTDIPTYKQIDISTAKIISDCNTDPSPAQCLRSRFTADIATMTATQQAFIAGYTERGDPATASALALKIAGRYRHTFENGDVQGHHYRSADTLTLTPVGHASIQFDAELSFYNGHSCSLSGGALYRKDGAFVFDDDPANALPNDPVCHLAIRPTANGITFQDLTHGCKMYCGARGTLDGAAFTFAERAPSHSSQNTSPK